MVKAGVEEEAAMEAGAGLGGGGMEGSAFFGSGGERSGTVMVVQAEASGRMWVVASCKGGGEDDKQKRIRVALIDPTTGHVIHHGRCGFDLFTDEVSATDELARVHGSLKVAGLGAALAGYVRYGDVGYLLIVTKADTTMCLPTGASVRTVRESQWVRIQLRDPALRLTKAEEKTAAQLTELQLEGCFYCETADVSRPFGSAAASREEPEQEFVWNSHLTRPLVEAGMGDCCITLLQGFAQERKLKDADGREFVLCHVARRSSMHAGTRYLARGMNESAEPGNEMECEQLIYRCADGEDAWEDELEGDDKGSVVKFCSYVWRRGTVPIWWGQEIKNTVGEAEIYVGENPYRGTAAYFRRVQGQHELTNGPENSGFTVTCINLLRCAPGKAELLLQEHFHEGVRQARRQISTDATYGEISVLNFDWHANVKALGEASAVEGLWALIQTLLVRNDLSCGSLVRGPSGDGKKSSVKHHVRQTGCLRYNCADSLDRTNAAAYFGCVQILPEQCRRLGLRIIVDPDLDVLQQAHQGKGRLSRLIGTGRGNGFVTQPNQLPDGWESRVDPITGRTFYIDHVHKKTTWVLPTVVMSRTGSGNLSENKEEEKEEDMRARPDQKEKMMCEEVNSSSSNTEGECAGVLDQWYMHPANNRWLLFDKSVDYVRAAFLPAIMFELTDLFLSCGDVAAGLYTGSRAMHTAILHLLERDPDVRRQRSSMGNVSNAGIAIQRRYLNVVHDEKKQLQFDLMLGVRLERHLPSHTFTNGNVDTVISRIPDGAICMNFGGQDVVKLQNFVLGAPKRTAWSNCWLCEANIPKLCIALARPALVTRIILYLGHGVDDAGMPRAFDVYVGRHLDRMKLAVAGLAIPRCDASKDDFPSALSYPIPLTSNYAPEYPVHSIPSEPADCPQHTSYGTVPAQTLYNIYEDNSRTPDFQCQFVTIVFRGGGLASGCANRSSGYSFMGNVEVIGSWIDEGGCTAAAAGDQDSDAYRAVRDSAGRLKEEDILAQQKVKSGFGNLDGDLRPPEDDETQDSMPWHPLLDDDEKLGNELKAIDDLTADMGGVLADAAQLEDQVVSERRDSFDVETAMSLFDDSAKSRYAERLAHSIRIIHVSNTFRKLIECLRLEITRLRLNMTPEDRAAVMRSMSIQAEDVDPNRFLAPGGALQVRDKISETLLSYYVSVRGEQAGDLMVSVESIISKVLRVNAGEEEAQEQIIARFFSAALLIQNIKQEVRCKEARRKAQIAAHEIGYRNAESKSDATNGCDIENLLAWPNSSCVFGVPSSKLCSLPFESVLTGSGDVWTSTPVMGSTEIVLKLTDMARVATINLSAGGDSLTSGKVRVTAFSSLTVDGERSLLAVQEEVSPASRCVTLNVDESGVPVPLCRFVVLCFSSIDTQDPFTIKMCSLSICGRAIQLPETSCENVPAEDNTLLLARENFLGEPAVMARTIVQPGWMEGNRSGGTVMEIGLPASISWVSGFKLRLPKDVQVPSTPTKIKGFTLEGYEQHPVLVRVTVFQEQQAGSPGRTKSLESGFVGDFFVPTADSSVSLHFDFKSPIVGRVFVFEFLGSQRDWLFGNFECGVNAKSGTVFSRAADNWMRSCSQSIKLYRYLVQTK